MWNRPLASTDVNICWILLLKRQEIFSVRKKALELAFVFIRSTYYRDYAFIKIRNIIAVLGKVSEGLQYDPIFLACDIWDHRLGRELLPSHFIIHLSCLSLPQRKFIPKKLTWKLQFNLVLCFCLVCSLIENYFWTNILYTTAISLPKLCAREITASCLQS